MLTLCTSSLCVCAYAQKAGPAIESSLRFSLARSSPPSFAHPARRGQISQSQEGSPEKDQVVGVRLPRLAHVGHSGLAARRSLRFLLQGFAKTQVSHLLRVRQPRRCGVTAASFALIVSPGLLVVSKLSINESQRESDFLSLFYSWPFPTTSSATWRFPARKPPTTMADARPMPHKTSADDRMSDMSSGPPPPSPVDRIVVLHDKLVSSSCLPVTLLTTRVVLTGQRAGLPTVPTRRLPAHTRLEAT
jgi:hypothetical protein